MTESVTDAVAEGGLDLGYGSGVDLASMVLTLAKYALVTFIVLLIFGFSCSFSRGRLILQDTRAVEGA